MPAKEEALTIAITGGMGSGKSTAARLLHLFLGGVRFDADLIARELLQPGAGGWLALTRAFGGRFLLPDLTVNRSLLRRLLFEDESLRKEVNSLIHPLVRERIRQDLSKLRGHAVRLVEIPLLFEAGWESDFSTVVVVYACREQCVGRLKLRDGLSSEGAEQAIAAQLPLLEKVLRADHVLDNSGPLAEAWLQSHHLAGLCRRNIAPDRVASR